MAVKIEKKWNTLLDAVQIYVRTCKVTNVQGTQSYERVNAYDVATFDDNVPVDQSYMFTKNIRGTAAYWKEVLHKLLAMILTLGPPHFFMTLSCNDQWPELKEAIQCDTPGGSVSSNPLMAVLAFQRRWEALLKYVIHGPNKPLGNIKDSFIRCEFQNRGSVHLHIFLWSDIGVDLNTSPVSDIINLIDRCVSTVTPSYDANPIMHDIVKKFQTHRHTSTCKKNHSQQCRFHFPYRPIPSTRLIQNLEHIARRRGRFYETKRGEDDAYINAYNPLILQHWRGNMDIQVIGNVESCAYYVFKYVCKAEPTELKDMLGALFSEASFWSMPIRQQKIKIGVQVLKSRKIGAQEIIYRIGGLKLYSASRTFVSIITQPPHLRYKLLKPAEERAHVPPDCSEEHTLFVSNILDYYRCRPLNLENVSFYHFASNYKLSSGPLPTTERASPRFQLLAPHASKTIMQRKKFVVLKPTYFSPNNKNYHYACLLLYKTHQSEYELLVPYQNYTKTFQNTVQRLRLSNFLDTYNDDLENMSDSGMYASLGQDSLSENIVHPTETSLSHETTDNSDRSPPCIANSTTLEQNIAKMSSDQKLVFDHVRRHNIAQNNSPLRLLITGGRGGTGKSFLLQLLTDYVGITHAISAHHHQVIVGAPRGIAARNVKACTIHSIFRLPVQHGYEAQLHAISAQNLKILREKFRYVTTIILDEISMISMKTFEYIHERLCNIADNNHPFGNYNIICFGDFYQLRPVRGHYLFKHQVLWDLFQPFFLFANQRQAGDNDFIAMLNNIRLGMLTVADVDMLQTRFTSRHPNVNLTAPVHIYPTLKEVHAHNSYMQNTLDSETYEHAAIHTFGMYDPRSGQKVPPELFTTL